ncbi:MAG: DNA recombination protein RmuC [Lutimonas sp.]
MIEDDTFLYFILIFLVGILLTYLIFKVRTDRKITFQQSSIESLKDLEQKLLLNVKELTEQLNEERNKNESLIIDLTKTNAQLDYARQKMHEQMKDIEHLQQKFKDEFEVLANKILEEKTKKYTQTNKDNLTQILDPLKEKIKSFESKVENIHRDTIDRQSALKEQISGLMRLNEKMSTEALNLTKALKGDQKKQGDWGEFQLETLLERSGLKKDIHFSTQTGQKDDEGLIKRPDFIIHLPENKCMIIDAKVSLKGYEMYYNSNSPEEENEGLKKLMLSIKNHIKNLNQKKYEALYGVQSPDFVLMYIPVEPALMVALKNDKNIFLEALHKNVVLVSTSTLLATLSTVASIWKQEDQKQNVIEIAKHAGSLYDKFEGFIQDMIKIGNQLDASKNSYDNAMNKLSTGKGNIVGRIDQLKKLGANAQKSLPENLVKKALNK